MITFRLGVFAALFAAIGTPAAAQGMGQTVNVFSYGFSPKAIHLRADQPVTLNFVNNSGSSHDFVAPALFARSTVTSGSAPHGEIDLPPHSSRTITLVPRAGTYKAHCSHFMHKQMGMEAEIVVD